MMRLSIRLISKALYRMSLLLPQMFLSASIKSSRLP